MAEYVKREYAVDAVLDVYCDTPDVDLSCEKFEAAIRKIQAADVAPVRHGRWLDGKCTVCGWEEPDVCTWLGYDSEAWIETQYCPNCGAIMDGDRL